GGGGNELQVVGARHHEPRIRLHRLLQLGAEQGQRGGMADEEALHERALAEEIRRIQDDLHPEALLIRVLLHRERLLQAVEMVVAVEERVDGRVDELVVDLGQEAAREGEREEIAAFLVIADERPVVEDAGVGQAQLLAEALRSGRHAPGGERDAQAALARAVESLHEGRIELGLLRDQGPVEVADEEVPGHAQCRPAVAGARSTAVARSRSRVTQPAASLGPPGSGQATTAVASAPRARTRARMSPSGITPSPGGRRW